MGEQKETIPCWKYKGCGGERRANCPAFKQDRTTECWKVIGKDCEDIESVYGRPNVKKANCDICLYYQFMNPKKKSKSSGPKKKKTSPKKKASTSKRKKK